MNPFPPWAPFTWDEEPPDPIDPNSTRKGEIGNARQEIGEILGRLGRCCLPTDDNFRWPEKGDLERLDDLVLDIWVWIRSPAKKQKHRRFEIWPKYLRVDHRWPGLHLCKGIEALLKRVRDNAPSRPFASLYQLPGNRALVTEFFTIHPKIYKGLLQVVSVPWEDFEPMFLAFRRNECGRLLSRLETRLGNAEGGARLVAYAVYLEIKGEEQAWLRNNLEGALNLTHWVSYCLHEVKLMGMVKRLALSSEPTLMMEWRAKDRQNDKRKAAKERKSRERARKRKKLPAKSVTDR